MSRGPNPYQSFVEWSASPVVIAVNAAALLFVVFHAITWFNLAPQAISLRVRGQRVPAALIAVSNYAAWALESTLVFWLLLRRAP